MTAPLLKFLALVLGFAMWGALGYFGKVPLDPLIALLQMGLGGLITHMLQADAAGAMPAAPSPAVPAAPPAVAGRSLWAYPMLLAALAFCLAMLGGCTTTTASVYRGYTSEAVAGVKMWDDNTLATLQTVLCAQPYSAIQRHPELQPGVQSLCGPLANSSSLDANQLAMLMQLLNASGVKLQAAPAK